MTCCTEIADSNLSNQMRTMQYSIQTVTREEAIETIELKIQQIAPASQLTNDIWQFWVDKFVSDVLDYCHREDFPKAMIYACIDLILKRMADAEAGAATLDEEGVAALPLSAIKMDDTTFNFDTSYVHKTSTTDNVGLLSDLDFDSIKPKLNLYRKAVSR